MISKQLLDVLVCPETRAPLKPAEAELVARLNRAIAEGALKNNAGQRVESSIDDGLVREDGKVLYPVVGEIPNMLVDRAIPLSQLEPGGDALHK